ncbi:ROK family protein, partial [Dactylosporangium sp. NPDC049525]|uniref:ROK family protein n=1 Tax=Dactylosporangium sp. NPDC049525 TaxID=3154730 RepID=UPI003426450A
PPARRQPPVGSWVLDPGPAGEGDAGPASAAASPGRGEVPASVAAYPVPATTALSTAVDELVRRAEAEDSRAIAALADAGNWLGIGAAAVCAILDPRLVVLGGHYTRLAPWMLTSVRSSFDASLLVTEADPPQIEQSVLGAWGSVEGAALAVLEQMLDGIRPLPIALHQPLQDREAAG